MDTSRGAIGKKKVVVEDEEEEEEEAEEEEEEEEEEDEDVSGMGYGDHHQEERRKRLILTTSVVSNKRGTRAGGSAGPPLCQVENCNADLTDSKHYHRRHKVCEFHAKASVVLTAGSQQRFCQQCSRFHMLSEFDDSKRSCRRRLAGHNERRRKGSSDPHGDMLR